MTSTASQPPAEGAARQDSSAEKTAQQEPPAGCPKQQDSPAPVGRSTRLARNVARACFLVVFAINVQCALSFVLWPESFQGAYELTGHAGAAAVQGMGVAFLMWNATYPAFIAAPHRFRVLGWVILAQQAIGLGGESVILASLPAGASLLHASILRFIWFDAAGLALMGVSFAWLLAAERMQRARAQRSTHA